GPRNTARPPRPGPPAPAARPRGPAPRAPGIRRGCHIHAAGTTWKRHPRRITRGKAEGRTEQESRQSHDHREPGCPLRLAAFTGRSVPWTPRTLRSDGDIRFSIPLEGQAPTGDPAPYRWVVIRSSHRVPVAVRGRVV